MFNPDGLYQVRSTGTPARFLGTLKTSTGPKTVWAIQSVDNNGNEYDGLRDEEGRHPTNPQHDIIPIEATSGERVLMSRIYLALGNPTLARDIMNDPLDPVDLQLLGVLRHGNLHSCL